MEKGNSIVVKLTKYLQLHYLMNLVTQPCKVGRDDYFAGEEIKERKSLTKIPELS